MQVNRIDSVAATNYQKVEDLYLKLSFKVS